jgi:hypothetical protein
MKTNAAFMLFFLKKGRILKHIRQNIFVKFTTWWLIFSHQEMGQLEPVHIRTF